MVKPWLFPAALSIQPIPGKVMINYTGAAQIRIETKDVNRRETHY